MSQEMPIDSQTQPKPQQTIRLNPYNRSVFKLVTFFVSFFGGFYERRKRQEQEIIDRFKERWVFKDIDLTEEQIDLIVQYKIVPKIVVKLKILVDESQQIASFYENSLKFLEEIWKEQTLRDAIVSNAWSALISIVTGLIFGGLAGAIGLLQYKINLFFFMGLVSGGFFNGFAFSMITLINQVVLRHLKVQELVQRRLTVDYAGSPKGKEKGAEILALLAPSSGTLKRQTNNLKLLTEGTSFVGLLIFVCTFYTSSVHWIMLSLIAIMLSLLVTQVVRWFQLYQIAYADTFLDRFRKHLRDLYNQAKEDESKQNVEGTLSKE